MSVVKVTWPQELVSDTARIWSTMPQSLLANKDGNQNVTWCRFEQIVNTRIFVHVYVVLTCINMRGFASSAYGSAPEWLHFRIVSSTLNAGL